MMLGTTIIVVSWNCSSFIGRFVAELNTSLSEVSDFEVLIFDNASSDGTADILTEIIPFGFRLVRSEENLGFAKANNILIQQARYERIILLNPDVFDYPKNFWRNLEAIMERESADVGFVKLLNPDGSFQDCVGDFPSPMRSFASLRGRKRDFSRITTPTLIEVGIMAFLATTKSVFNEVGLINERFHMYCEDVEWCFRANRCAKKVMYLPDLSLTHIGGASAESRWKGMRKNLIKYESESIFIRMHYTGMRLCSMWLINICKRLIVRVRLFWA